MPRRLIRRTTYPLQISVNYMEFMHILQATCNASQLNGSSVTLLRDQMITYKLGAVYMPVPLDELVNVSVLQPLGNESKSVLVQCHSKQR